MSVTEPKQVDEVIRCSGCGETLTLRKELTVEVVEGVKVSGWGFFIAADLHRCR